MEHLLPHLLNAIAEKKIEAKKKKIKNIYGDVVDQPKDRFVKNEKRKQLRDWNLKDHNTQYNKMKGK